MGRIRDLSADEETRRLAFVRWKKSVTQLAIYRRSVCLAMSRSSKRQG